MNARTYIDPPSASVFMGGKSAGGKMVDFVGSSCGVYSPDGFDYNSQNNHAYLIVNGAGYVLAAKKEHQKFKLSDYRIQPPNYDPRPDRYSFWHRSNFGFEIGKENKFFIEISRKLNQPVFVITKINHAWGGNDGQVAVHGNIPILQTLGMPAIIDPYQMYQQTAMFVGNVLRDPPDTAPPVELSNKGKILKAGFDLVKSFRHRK